jgi:hypothetical protein
MAHTGEGGKSRGIGAVGRIVDDNLAYVSMEGGARTLSFSSSVVNNYRGETLEELNIRENSRIEVEWNEGSDLVTQVLLRELPSSIEAVALLPRRTPAIRQGALESADVQNELHPKESPTSVAIPMRALPAATRSFGKLVDTTKLLAGDLLLSRDLKPDRISKLIYDVQRDGGYHVDDARWTHAAMYVGDGSNVVEATFDSPMSGGDVRLTSLDAYCDGSYCLRFRRSRFLATERDGWRVCVRALSRLKMPYDFLEAARMWFKCGN